MFQFYETISVAVEFIISPNKLFDGINSFSNIQALNHIHCVSYEMQGSCVFFALGFGRLCLYEYDLSSLIILIGFTLVHIGGPSYSVPHLLQFWEAISM